MPGNERVKIIFINHWASRIGGAECSLLDILEAAARRADVYLVTTEMGPLVERAEALGVTVRRIPCSSSLGNVRRGGLARAIVTQWRGMLSFALFVLRLRNYCALIRPHLVHANVPKSHMALFLCAQLGIGAALCVHIREIFIRGSLPHRLYALLFPQKRCSVIAISNAVAMALPAALRRKAAVIYNGVDVPDRDAVPRADPSSGPRFLYLGRVVPWKGCHLLVEAFSLLHKQRGDRAGSLDLIGDTMYWDASYRQELVTAIARSGCGHACRLLPHTATPQGAMLDHDVFCIASDNEPFGRVAAEAGACGLPVIAFAQGGIVEIVEHGRTGLLVPDGDVAALAEAMGAFVGNRPAIERMGTAARERVAGMFNKTAQMNLIVNRLLELAGTGGKENAVSGPSAGTTP